MPASRCHCCKQHQTTKRWAITITYIPNQERSYDLNITYHSEKGFGHGDVYVDCICGLHTYTQTIDMSINVDMYILNPIFCFYLFKASEIKEVRLTWIVHRVGIDTHCYHLQIDAFHAMKVRGIIAWITTCSSNNVGCHSIQCKTNTEIRSKHTGSSQFTGLE